MFGLGSRIAHLLVGRVFLLAMEGANMSTSTHTDGGSGVTTFIGPLLLTPTQAATDLAIGRTKVFELLRSGELESVRIGSNRRIPREALQDYVSRLRHDEHGRQHVDL